MDDNMLQVAAAISKGSKSSNHAVPVTILLSVGAPLENIQKVLRRH